MKKLALVALAAAALSPLVATARHTAVHDPNDTKGTFDVQRAEMARGQTNKWKIKTFAGWSTVEVWDRGFVLIYLDTFGTRRADYYALVRSNGREMVGTLYRDRSNKNDYRIRGLGVSHKRRDVVKVTLGFQGLRRRASRVYRWYSETLWSGDKCRRICFDRAPNNGSVVEPAPDVTPTVPTPTPTVTP